MKTEFEATFIDIDVNEARTKLKKLGATLIKPERLMRRVNFFTPDDNCGWIRVRDEGDQVTLSYKRYLGCKQKGKEINDQQEIFLIINNFDEGVRLLKDLGLKQKSYQETKREEWDLNGVEISIDTWPGLDPLIEIEAKDEATVKKVSQELGFDYEKAVFGPITLVYEMKYGISQKQINNETPEITFEKPPFNK